MTKKNCGKKYHLVHCLLLRVSMQRVCFSSSKYLVFIFCLLALLQAWNIKAQPHFATYKPHLHNRDSLMVFYDRIFFHGCWIDSNWAFKITDSISLYAKAQGNEELLLDAELCRANFLGLGTLRKEEAHYKIRQVKNKAKELGNIYLQIRACNIEGQLYYSEKQYQLTFECYFESWPLLSTISDNDYPDKLRHTYDLGLLYYRFGDFKQAAFHLGTALQIELKPTNIISIYAIYNTLGLSYRFLNMPDSSDYYFNKMIYLASCPPVWCSVAQSNLAENYILRGLYAQATPLLQAQLKESKSRHDQGLMANAYMWLADIAFRTENIAEATRKTLLAREVLEQTKSNAMPEPYQRFQQLFALLCRMHAAAGHSALATSYMDSTMAAKDSLDRQFNAMKLLRAQQKESQQKQAAQLDLQRQKRIAQRNLLLTIICFMAVASVLLYTNQRRKYKNHQLQKNLELQKARTDMENANIQLQDFALRISEKNNLLEQFEAKMVDSHAGELKELHHSSILSHEEWERFSVLFDKVHDGYLQNLRLKIPHVSPAEMRFMALARLGFSNKEMAAAIGVSAEAIRSVWHRLRKKLNLCDDTRLEDFVQSIDPANIKNL